MTDLTKITGDYFTITWAGRWIVHRETCRAGSVPIGDARFKYAAPDDDTSENIIHTLMSYGVARDHIILQKDKGK